MSALAVQRGSASRARIQKLGCDKNLVYSHSRVTHFVTALRAILGLHIFSIGPPTREMREVTRRFNEESARVFATVQQEAEEANRAEAELLFQGTADRQGAARSLKCAWDSWFLM